MSNQELHELLGQNIRMRRKELGLTQDELAKRIDVSRTSLTNMELGRQRLLVDQLYSMASALKSNPSDLLPSASQMRNKTRNAPSEPIPESVQRFADQVRAESKRAGSKK